MTRLESSTDLDSFAMEAAARRHRSEGYGRAFDAAVNWVENHLLNLGRSVSGYTSPAAVHLHRPASR